MATESLEDESLSEEEQEELLQEVERKRSLQGAAAVAVALIGISFSAFQMWIAARGSTFYLAIPFTGIEYTITSLQQLQLHAVHVTFALVLAFLLFPISTGEGGVARRFESAGDAVTNRFSSTSPVSTATERLRGGMRWVFLDPNGTRVTPADYGLVFLSLLPPWYMLRHFDEITSLRAAGIASGRPIQEVYPFLDLPVTLIGALGIPIDEVSYAFLMGVLGILLILEATRRVLSLFLMILVALFLVYARFGYIISPGTPFVGQLAIAQLTWEGIVSHMWYTTQGIFGIPVRVSVRFIYIFILFGAFLEMSGAGKWFIDLAYSLTGTRRGGPAKASVVSSGFMGMLSGSSVANTVTTGAFTIPLMKRSGYSPEFAGGVESSVSSGGQILPPVMGAAAFLIVEFTGTPFADVIVAAALPALAFFFGMWVMVHLQAGRRGIGGLDRSELIDIPTQLREGWFYLLPIFVLLYLLIIERSSIGRAGWLTIVAIIALVAFVAAYNERTRIPLLGAIAIGFLAELAARLVGGLGLAELLSGGEPEVLSFGAALAGAAQATMTITILVSLLVLLIKPHLDAPLLDLDPSVEEAANEFDARTGRSLATSQLGRFATFVLRSMDSGARTATTVVIAVAAAGVVPGVIGVTGLGPNLNALIQSVSGGSLLVLLLLTGVASVILGMGMPTTVMYVILVSMLAGTIEDLGIAILAAHLFILYFGLMADVTPPVAVAAYAAAGVAKAEEWKTGMIAFMLSLNKILVPFAFVFSPGILLLRDGELIGSGDLLDLSYSVPEVLIPILGMFAGVYAMGVAIIGYYDGEVPDTHRLLFGVTSVMLMAPMLILLALQGIGRLTGIWFVLDTLTFDLALRAVGVVLLVALLRANKGSQEEDEPQPVTGTPTD